MDKPQTDTAFAGSIPRLYETLLVPLIFAPYAKRTRILLIVGVLWDAFETAVLSRRVSSGTRLTTLFYRLTWP